MDNEKLSNQLNDQRLWGEGREREGQESALRAGGIYPHVKMKSSQAFITLSGEKAKNTEQQEEKGLTCGGAWETGCMESRKEREAMMQ